MSQSTESVVACFRVLRTFCGNVGTLLTKANELMKEGGWDHIWRRTPVLEICDDLDDPNCWLPDTFFCYYEQTDSHILPFIVVLVDDLCSDDYEPDRVKEALISAGWLEYAAGTNARDEWDKDLAVHYSHLWMKDRRDDGTSCSGDARDVWENDEIEAGTVKVTTFALPLGEISTTDELDEKIVQPLLTALEEKS